MKYVRTNFNFEQQLLEEKDHFSFDFISNNSNYEFEYLFFFIQAQGILNTPILYESKYKDYLKIKFNLDVITEIRPQQNYDFWWGDLKDFKKSQKLNDKLFFWKYCLEFGLPYPVTIIDYTKLNLLSNFVIARKRLGFSGIGLKILNKSEIKALDKNYIYSSYMKKDFDFGLFFSQNDILIYQNEIDQSGKYKGSKTLLESDLYNKLSNLNIFQKLKKIRNITGSNYQVDGFVSNGEIFFNEMNFRLTMGSIFSLIMNNYFPGKNGNIKILKYSEYLKITDKDRQLYFLTPRLSNFKYRFGIILEISESI